MTQVAFRFHAPCVWAVARVEAYVETYVPRQFRTCSSRFLGRSACLRSVYLYYRIDRSIPS
jgi:hypothetical protein